MHILRCVFLFICLTFSVIAPCNANQANKISLLYSYIGADYANAVADGQVIDAGEYQEMQEFSETAHENLQQLLQSSQLSPTLQQQLLADAKQLKTLIAAKKPLAQVNDLALSINQAVLDNFAVINLPKQVPNLAQAQELYTHHCGGCHGITGYGDGPLGQNLEPTPSNFHETEHMQKLSVFTIFNTISQGVAGTAMNSYQAALSEQQRWDLAFFIAGMHQPTSNSIQMKADVDLNKLVSQTPEQILSKEGPESLQHMHYLIQHPQVTWHKAAAGDGYWTKLEQMLNQSFASYQQGFTKKAYNQAIDAYLEAFEPLEATIDAYSVSLRKDTEARLLAYREGIKNELAVTQLQAKLDAAKANIKEAQTTVNGSSLSGLGLFLSALMILLREGLEIILVMAMVFTILVKADKREALKYAHLGWISAIIAGLATWIVSHELIEISGASREMTEGFTAIIAAAILLYVGIWIHRQSAGDQWRVFLKEKLSHTMSAASLWGVSSLCFLAVYREMFEIILFYEALGSQAAEASFNMIAAGALSAIVLLLGIVWLIKNIGLRLPLNQFFKVSSLIILVLSIVFLGQGLHALEEAGKFPLYSVNMPTLSLVGLYPNLYSVLMQLILATTIVLFMRNKPGNE